MKIRIEGKLHAFFYHPERQQAVLMMEDRSKHILYIPGHFSPELLDTIGLTQPGDEVVIEAIEPGLCNSTVTSWENVSLTRWLSNGDGKDTVMVPA